MLEPVFGERALFTTAGGAPTLIVGDLHVGLERELRRAGVRLPSQTERMRARLQRLVADTGARRLVVLGDLKESVARPSEQELEELPDFFDGVDARVELVPGNHDGDIAPLVPGVEVRDAAGITLGDGVGLAHGHTWPAEEVMACRHVAVCHNHPMVMLRDELGHRHKEPCWLRGAFTAAARERYPGLPTDARVVVIPAFNDLLGGVALNATEGRRLIGPLFRNGLVDVDASRVYTLDGVELGTVAALRAYGDAPGKGGGKRRGGAAGDGAGGDAP